MLELEPDEYRRLLRVQAEWDEETEYLRRHGTWGGSPWGKHLLKIRRKGKSTLEVPRGRFVDRGRKPAHSTVGGGYEQEELGFELACYLMDH